jgi:hypothetical protein
VARPFWFVNVPPFLLSAGVVLHPGRLFFYRFVSGPFDSGTGSPDGFLCIVPL